MAIGFSRTSKQIGQENFSSPLSVLGLYPPAAMFICNEVKSLDFKEDYIDLQISVFISEASFGKALGRRVISGYCDLRLLRHVVNSNMADAMLSTFEHAYIVGGVEQDLRADGRSCQDYRHFEVETGIVSNTSGSARLRLVIILSFFCKD